MDVKSVLNETKAEVIIADRSTMTKIGRQLAQQAAYTDRGVGAKKAAEAAANRAYSMMLMGIDEYFDRKSEKVVK